MDFILKLCSLHRTVQCQQKQRTTSSFFLQEWGEYVYSYNSMISPSVCLIINNNNNSNNNNNNNNRIESCDLRFFCNLLSSPGTVSNTYAQVARSQSCANHVQHIECLSHATVCVTCHVVRRVSSTIKVDRVEIAFIWDLFFGWTINR